MKTPQKKVTASLISQEKGGVPEEQAPPASAGQIDHGSVPLGVVILDGRARVCFVNDRICEWTGFTAEEIIAGFPETLFSSAGTKDSTSKSKLLKFSNDSTFRNGFLRTKTGPEIAVYIRQIRLFDAAADGRGMAIIVTTDAEKMTALPALSDSENRYQLLFNSGNDAVFVFHLTEGGLPEKFVEVNTVACQMLGMSREKLLHERLPQLLPKSDLKPLLLRLKKLKHYKRVLIETHFLTNAGNTLPVEINAQLFRFNQRPAVIAIARDISARKRTEAQLREQAALLDKAQDAILVLDLNNYIVYWNKSAERLYGWKVEEALGTDGFALLYKRNSQRFSEARQATLKQGEWQGEMRQLNKDRQEIVVESRWTLVNSPQRTRTILVVNTDITERKQIEAQFLRAQRMESIGSLAGGIAHDLNNVLAPILTAVQVLQARLSEDDRNQKILDTIEGNIRRGADMVKQILSFARGVEGDRMPVNLALLLDEIEKITRETFPKSIEIQINVPQKLWNVSGDMTQLHQVLLNLCVNARDAMPEGGMLSINGSNVKIDAKFTRTHLEARPGKFVRISVTDSGAGISEELLNRIFEPFFTTKAPGKGTGLGLSTVMAIVKSHEGFIHVESEPGHGTSFEIYLPALIEEHFPELTTTATDYPPGNNECILIIDDEPSVLEISRMTLESHGYRVLSASDGAEALGIFARHKAEIDLVITDMMMPVMDGIATIQALQKLKPGVRIVASSGYLEDERLKQFIDDGECAYLQKPYTGDTLLAVVHEQLKREK